MGFDTCIFCDGIGFTNKYCDGCKDKVKKMPSPRVDKLTHIILDTWLIMFPPSGLDEVTRLLNRELRAVLSERKRILDLEEGDCRKSQTSKRMLDDFDVYPIVPKF